MTKKVDFFVSRPVSGVRFRSAVVVCGSCLGFRVGLVCVVGRVCGFVLAWWSCSVVGTDRSLFFRFFSDF